MKNWTEPGAPEAQTTARVDEYPYGSGSDFVYEVICASGGNTSSYRRRHTDKPFRQGNSEALDALQSGGVVGRVVLDVRGVP